ncbi:MAG: hypothetical protein ACLVJO_01235 [[Clostridium] scindens]
MKNHYNAQINNWLDIRTNEISVDEAGAVAWCHGWRHIAIPTCAIRK